MAVDSGRLALSNTQLLVEKSILAVELALNRNPAPDDRIDLMDHLSDLRTLRDQLQARRIQIANSGETIPPPSPELISQVQALTAQVEAARNAGTAANAVIDVARQAFAVAAQIKPHFG